RKQSAYYNREYKERAHGAARKRHRNSLSRQSEVRAYLGFLLRTMPHIVSRTPSLTRRIASPTASRGVLSESTTNRTRSAFRATRSIRLGETQLLSNIRTSKALTLALAVNFCKASSR